MNVISFSVFKNPHCLNFNIISSSHDVMIHSVIRKRNLLQLKVCILLINRPLYFKLGLLQTRNFVAPQSKRCADPFIRYIHTVIFCNATEVNIFATLFSVAPYKRVGVFNCGAIKLLVYRSPY